MTSAADKTSKSYSLEQSPALSAMLQHLEGQRAAINVKKAERPDLWPVIQEKLRVTWTYDSNAIEGSTLSYGDTLFFLKEGLTVEGKPFKDFLDAKNHAEAIDFLAEVILHKRPFTEGLIKEINALLLSGVKSTPAMNEQGQRIDKPATPGEYKKLPNHVLKPDGTIHHYVEPLQAPSEMAALCSWITEQSGKLSPVALASIAHYNMVRIHPFDDGNGRGARILMNLILMQAGYTPAIVKNEHRRKYLEALVEADTGNLEPFVDFIAASLAETQEMILADLG